MRWRIWLLSLGITLFSVLVLSFATTQVYYNSSVDDAKKFLRVYMNAFDESLYSLDEAGALAFSEKLDGARVTFMDAQGNVLADSLAGSGVNHSDRTEIKDAVFKGEGFAVRGSSTLGKNMVYYCKNFDGRFLVRLAIFTDSDWSIFASTLPTLAMFSGLMIALSLVAAFVATHFIISPVKKLAQEAAENKGEVTAKYSELAPIADILNGRNKSLSVQMDEIKREKELVDRTQASKDEFISNVTHEMNTPLTSIRGYAELLNAGGMTEEQKGAAYTTIMAQSDRLANLIACIINYSEIDSDGLAPYEVDLSALARETLGVLRPEADKHGVELIGKIEDGIKISSRHELLSEILGNLVRNAIRYNRRGGTVTVTVNAERLCVEDTGIGIAEENLDRIFDRFYTVDKSHDGKNGGFGLGLAVVKKICRKSGWNLSVESVEGKGSKFTIEF